MVLDPKAVAGRQIFFDLYQDPVQREKMEKNFALIGKEDKKAKVEEFAKKLLDANDPQKEAKVANMVAYLIRGDEEATSKKFGKFNQMLLTKTFVTQKEKEEKKIQKDLKKAEDKKLADEQQKALLGKNPPVPVVVEKKDPVVEKKDPNEQVEDLDMGLGLFDVIDPVVVQDPKEKQPAQQVVKEAVKEPAQPVKQADQPPVVVVQPAPKKAEPAKEAVKEPVVPQGPGPVVELPIVVKEVVENPMVYGLKKAEKPPVVVVQPAPQEIVPVKVVVDVPKAPVEGIDVDEETLRAIAEIEKKNPTPINNEDAELKAALELSKKEQSIEEVAIQENIRINEEHKKKVDAEFEAETKQVMAATAPPQNGQQEKVEKKESSFIAKIGKLLSTPFIALAGLIKKCFSSFSKKKENKEVV